jgi:flagellar assembly factor FliW
MTVETTRFGQLDVDPCRVITVPRGLIGFPSAQRFIMFEHSPGLPFQWLQSLDNPSLAFIVIDPHTFFPDYEIEIAEEEARGLGIRDPDEAQVLTMVTIRRAPNEVTTNLVGPLVVGVNSRQAAQIVLNGDQYTTRHRLPAAQPVAYEPKQEAELQPCA